MVDRDTCPCFSAAVRLLVWAMRNARDRHEER